jgi:hypothetical protein
MNRAAKDLLKRARDLKRKIWCSQRKRKKAKERRTIQASIS